MTPEAPQSKITAHRQLTLKRIESGAGYVECISNMVQGSSLRETRDRADTEECLVNVGSKGVERTTMAAYNPGSHNCMQRRCLIDGAVQHVVHRQCRCALRRVSSLLSQEEQVRLLNVTEDVFDTSHLSGRRSNGREGRTRKAGFCAVHVYEQSNCQFILADPTTSVFFKQRS